MGAEHGGQGANTQPPSLCLWTLLFMEVTKRAKLTRPLVPQLSGSYESGMDAAPSADAALPDPSTSSHQLLLLIVTETLCSGS